MNILLVSHFFPPTYNAGTENYTLALAKALSKRGHATRVVCAEGWEAGHAHWNGVTDDRFEGIPVCRLHLNWMKPSDPNRSLYDNAVVESWFDHFLEKNRPDVVHVTSVASLGAGTLRSVHRAGIPLVLTLMDFWFLCPSIQLLRSDGSLCDGIVKPWHCQACLASSSRLFRRINRFLPRRLQPELWGRVCKVSFLTRRRGLRGLLLDVENRQQFLKEMLRCPDLVISHSEFLKHTFSLNGFADVSVLRQGHDLSWLARCREKSAGNLIRFGYLGQIQEIKGVHLLVEAMRRLDSRKPARLDIWGDLTRSPEYVNRLRERARGDSRIIFRGYCRHSDLAAVLIDTDVLVVPSLWYENSPLVIQEAFAAGTPVIASNLGGMSEAITHGVNGLLFERGECLGLAKQMQRLLDEPDLLSRLRKGIPRVKTSDDEAIQIETFYSDLLSHREQVRS
ncbi:MAG: glycosyltransferase family 4 protein [Acidobacteriales bacterium]|nr:glycosyltransferase family 4 protein [Terriglobales bacterium]